MRPVSSPYRRVYRLCVCAIMAALYFVLANYLTLRTGNLRITFASLPIVLLAVLFGPWESAVAAVLGEFLSQMLQYGFSATTLLWLIPPALRGILVAVGCSGLRRRNPQKEPWESPVAYGCIIVIAALLTTLANTLVIWLDSVIGHYYTFAYVFGDLLIRIAAGLASAVAVAAVSIPLLSALKKVVK